VSGVLLVAAGALASEGRRPGKPPLRYGRFFYCPSPYDYAAYSKVKGLRRVYYPRIHPARPSPRFRPARCYVSTRQAERAGYKLAPTPPGDLLLHGIYLVPAAPYMRRFCVAAARTAHIAVPCPGLVPDHPSAVPVCAPVTECTGDGFVYFPEASPPVPSDYVGDSRGSMHLWFVGFRTGRFQDEPCRPEDVVGRSAVTIRGRPGEFVTCTPGQSTHSGHVVAVWEEEGTVCEVSLHTDSQTNRDLDVAMAEGIVMVPPPA
jgi:hypothetical protein